MTNPIERAGTMKALGKMTDDEIRHELEHVAAMIYRCPLETMDARYRVGALCREAGKRIRWRNYRCDDETLIGRALETALVPAERE